MRGETRKVVVRATKEDGGLVFVSAPLRRTATIDDLLFIAAEEGLSHRSGCASLRFRFEVARSLANAARSVSVGTARI